MLMKMIKVIIVVVLVLFPVKVEGFVEQGYIDYASKINENWIRISDCGYPQNITSKETIKNRVEYIQDAIKKHHSKFNKRTTPHIDKEELFVYIWSTIAHETRWVNYAELDKGKSFGYISMQFSTADSLIRAYNLETDYYWDDQLQAELIVLYFYEKLVIYNVNYHLSIVAYNRGFNIDYDNYTNYRYLHEVLNQRENLFEYKERG